MKQSGVPDALTSVKEELVKIDGRWLELQQKMSTQEETLTQITGTALPGIQQDMKSSNENQAQMSAALTEIKLTLTSLKGDQSKVSKTLSDIKSRLEQGLRIQPSIDHTGKSFSPVLNDPVLRFLQVTMSRIYIKLFEIIIPRVKLALTKCHIFLHRDTLKSLLLKFFQLSAIILSVLNFIHLIY